MRPHALGPSRAADSISSPTPPSDDCRYCIQPLAPAQLHELNCLTACFTVKAKMEAESQQAKEIIQPLLDTENGFVKELERFLSQRDVAELRRRELQHKRWTERVWFPLQRKVEEHASSCSPVEAKRRQSLYSHYLHHCNTKGFVFLETYDPKEYNPFLLNIKQPHYFKADTLLLASSNYVVSASGKTPVKNETEGWKSSRLDTIPLHIRATATPDGRCHQAGCCFSRCGGRQQPTGLHQSLPPSK
ncbi:hypothetical protein GBF38_005939 [Nibea albiflora]|uniref:Uncharacterized protein n=1 Tax=Nibea albiflora TaxID=240163 RepID=A0ACB7FB52_NIBAL|nr:hypothetical protein GBF38_005939 [Nibea albiflora]